MKIALFPGSFDPFTLGHQAIVEDGLKIFDRIIIGIGSNNDKSGLLSLEKRLRLIDDVYKNDERVDVMAYDELTGDFCRCIDAKFLLRGMRNTVDYEYERNMMIINKQLFPEITTVLLFTPPQYVAISSSIIRDLLRFGGDPSSLLPCNIDIKNYI